MALTIEQTAYLDTLKNGSQELMDWELDNTVEIETDDTDDDTEDTYEDDWS